LFSLYEPEKVFNAEITYQPEPSPTGAATLEERAAASMHSRHGTAAAQHVAYHNFPSKASAKRYGIPR